MSSYFDSDTGRIHYQYLSKPGTGSPTLVFIHGAAGDLTVWHHQTSHFSRQYPILSVDLLHHGGSTSSNIHATLIDNAHAIHSLIRHLQIEDVIIFGHSLGGPVMLELSRLIDPSRITGLVSVDSLLPEKGSNFDGNSPEDARKMIAPFEGDFSATFGKNIEYWLENVPVESDKELVRRGIKDSTTKGVLAAMEDMCRWNVFEGLLRASDLPLRGIFAGETVSKNLRAGYDAYFPSLYIENCRHYLILEKSEEINQVIEQILQDFN